MPESIGGYQITGLLGEGAAALVYQGVRPDTGQLVAIKVMRDGHSPEHRTVDRFLAEVKAIRQIRHKNIIEILNYGELPDGRPYFVMEYLPGMTLQQRLDRDGPLTFLEAAPIFAQTCLALQAAHDAGTVHRDLKPDNLYLVDEESGPPLVKVLDFGIAKLITAKDSASLTQVGSTVGTPLYMSPEQIRALPLDPRSDIYTLGVSLFQTLTGEVPFYAESHAQTATMHLTQLPPRPSQVCDLLPIPEQAEHIVLRCLEKNPSARYANMNELRLALDAATKELLAARQLAGMRELRLSLPSVPPLPPKTSGGIPLGDGVDSATFGPPVPAGPAPASSSSPVPPAPASSPSLGSQPTVVSQQEGGSEGRESTQKTVHRAATAPMMVPTHPGFRFRHFFWLCVLAVAVAVLMLAARRLAY